MKPTKDRTEAAGAAKLDESLRVLALEPFYGGSHRQFLDQWAERSRHRFTILGLPSSHWKWRMRHAAPDLAREVAERAGTGEHWDVVFCSDMLDVAAFRGLAPRGVRDLPLVLYFHENQLTYPVRREDERDLHFGLTNVTSGLAATECWFNSEFHRRSFLEAVPELLRRMPDRRLRYAKREIERRSRTEWPGVESPAGSAETRRRSRRDRPLHVVWAARWEHDKGPEVLFEALDQLERLEPGLPWELSIAGRRYEEQPAGFEHAAERLGRRLAHFGPLPRARYLELLRDADVFLSTAHHEFFGLAAVEAVLAGARPLLPDRLSYPELLRAAGIANDLASGERSAFLWSGDTNELASRLRELARGAFAPTPKLTEAFRVFEWSRRRDVLDDRLAAVAETRPTPT